jgi:hypothetical protein
MTTYINDLEYLPIDFGQGLDDEHVGLGDCYFNDAFDAIVKKWNISKVLPQTAERIIRKQIEEIRNATEFIKENKGEFNFYAALDRFSYLNDSFYKYSFSNRYPKSFDHILILALYIRTNRHILDDEPDMKKRIKEGKRLLRDLKKTCNGKYPYLTDLKVIEERLKTFAKRDQHSIVKCLIEIENKLFNLHQDTALAAHYLSWHIDDEMEATRDW